MMGHLGPWSCCLVTCPSVTPQYALPYGVAGVCVRRPRTLTGPRVLFRLYPREGDPRMSNRPPGSNSSYSTFSSLVAHGVWCVTSPCRPLSSSCLPKDLLRPNRVYLIALNSTNLPVDPVPRGRVPESE